MSKHYATTVNDGDVCSFCGRPAISRSKHTGNYSCESSTNKCPAVKAKNSEGLKRAHQEGRLTTEHLDGVRAWSKGLSLTSNKEIFIENSRHTTEFIKKRIKKDNLLPHQCNSCGIEDQWMRQPLVLELDHINGNRNDNRLENLRFLCPNCHSQTPTFKGRNIKNGKKKVSDDLLLDLIRVKGYNIRQALIESGLAPMGANYKRVKKIINGGVA